MSTTRPESRRPARHACARGFALVSAIFILVVLTALGAAILTLTTGQHAGAALDVQGMRAYQAARAGIDYAAYRLLDPRNAGFATPNFASFTTCASIGAFPAGAFAGSDLDGFSVAIECNSTDHTVNGLNVRIYDVGATASIAAGTAYAVERKVWVRLGNCRDPSGDPGAQPPYRC
ncbi:MAG: pilus assembly PilX N-terminal domain-containing protein [Rhodocyclaceae bacterium]|jgi:MSHA biogenesis protein MshP|nr:pilus assembly PilX N-terminal domain-containing protein [Rhodocyclaceae bacterium]